MAEPITTAAAIVKGGAMVASGSFLMNAVIFQDHSYAYLAIVGAIVSMFGVMHQIFKEGATTYTFCQICAEITKGLALGVLAIPFWYLVLTEGILDNVTSFNLGSVSTSLALIISFALSWWTVPLFDWLVTKLIKDTK